MRKLSFILLTILIIVAACGPKYLTQSSAQVANGTEVTFDKVFNPAFAQD